MSKSGRKIFQVSVPCFRIGKLLALLPSETCVIHYFSGFGICHDQQLTPVFIIHTVIFKLEDIIRAITTPTPSSDPSIGSQ